MGVSSRLGTQCDHICVESFYHDLYVPLRLYPGLFFSSSSFVIYVLSVCITTVD